MARDTDKRASNYETENTGGLLSGFLAEEDVFDRRALWRLGAWGVASVGAVVLAVYVNQSSIAMRREQVAASDLARQAEQIHLVAKESQGEARRLASAIETLNGDRDRLYSRVTVLEQGLETVTGGIAKPQAATVAASPPPVSTPPASSAAAVTSDSPPAQKQPPPQGPVLGAAVSPVATTAPKPADKPVEKPSPVAAASPEPAPVVVASVAQKPSNPPATTIPTATAPATVTAPAITTTAAITSAPPLVTAKSMMGPPDPAATKLIEPEKPAMPDKLEKPEKAEKADKTDKTEKTDQVEKTDKAEKTDKSTKAITTAPMPEAVALASPADEAEADAKSLPKLPVQRTEFGVDVGSANSVGGLRALWRGLLKTRSNTVLTTLRPIIVIREGSNGLGMQLRLVAGPLDDAAAAAKICARLIENGRPCTTSVFDGQRLIMNADDSADLDKRASDNPGTIRPATSRYYVHRRGLSKRVAVEEPAKKPDPPPTLSSFFRRPNPQPNPQ